MPPRREEGYGLREDDQEEQDVAGGYGRDQHGGPRRRPSESHGGVLEQHGDGSLPEGPDEQYEEREEDVLVPHNGEQAVARTSRWGG